MSFSPPPTKNIIQATINGAWGNIPRVPWVSINATVGRQADRCTYDIAIQFKVEPHTVSCHLWRGRTADQDGGAVIANSSIPESELKVEPAAQHRLIQANTLKAIRFASGLLRESDPRIGIVVKEGELPSFPRGLLFDPPRMRPPAWERPPMDSVPCSFCNSGFGAGAPAMWSGGNLLWTHPSCWIRTFHGD